VFGVYNLKTREVADDLEEMAGAHGICCTAQGFADHQDIAFNSAGFLKQAMDQIDALLGPVGGEVAGDLS